MNTTDVKPDEKVVRSETVLTSTDPIFDPSFRPSPELALEMLQGSFFGYKVPMASVGFQHHLGLKEQQLFNCLFGRDSLLISELLVDTHPHLQRSSVLALAHAQGEAYDAASEEEPGKIPHEVRHTGDPRATELQEIGWKFPYYGSIDSTLIWIRSVLQICRRDPNFLSVAVNGKTISQRVEAATGWVVKRLQGPLGMIQSIRSNPNGILNQVWKDSGDSYQYPSGELPKHPIVSVETVAETFDALRSAIEILDLDSREWGIPMSILTELSSLQWTNLEKHFVHGDSVAMGLEITPDEVRPILTMASNQARLLDSAILETQELTGLVEAVAKPLLSSEMLGPNGLRTLSSAHPGYRPGGYHTGSAWPMDAAFAVRGLKRHGKHLEAATLATPTIEAIEAIGGYPELFRSDGVGPDSITTEIVDVVDSSGRSNRVCQPPQLIQGWTVAAYIWLKANI